MARMERSMEVGTGNWELGRQMKMEMATGMGMGMQREMEMEIGTTRRDSSII